MSDILIKGGLVIAEGKSLKADVLVCDGRISAIAPDMVPACGVETFDASDCVVVPGLADVHVHFREPGQSYKETIETGSRAAAHGGYTVVCTMPNLNPVPDTEENLQQELDLIDAQACIKVLPYASITFGRKGCDVVDIEALKDRVAGFSDDGSGVQDDKVMAEAMTGIAKADAILAAHCEDNSLLHGGYIHDGEYARMHGHKGICSESEWGPIARDVKLAAATGCRYHVCHVSAAESVDVIRQARRAGANVTCETGPHYLTMTDDDLQENGRFKMNPPLRSSSDRDALIAGIKDGTIEIIATDHAPHSAEEKSRGLSGSAMGVVGLETAFAVVFTKLVREGVISIEDQVRLMSENPRRIFRLGGGLEVGESADLAVFDISTPYKIDSNEFLSKGRATPFDGWEVYGKCKLTLYEGTKVWESR